MEKLKVRINNLNDLDENTLGSLLSDINVHGNGKKDDEVYELVDLFVKRVKSYLVNQIKTGSLTKEEAIDEVKAIKKLIKNYIDITGIRKIYSDNEFNSKNLKDVLEEKANVFGKKGENVMNGVDGIKQRIDDFHEINDIDSNTLESIIRGTVVLNEVQDREEVYASLTGKIWKVLSEELIVGKIDVTDFKNKVSDYRKKLEIYGHFSPSQIDDLFKKHGLDVEPEVLVATIDQSHSIAKTGDSGSSNAGSSDSSTSTTSTGDSSNGASDGNNGSTSSDIATTGDENQEQSDEQELTQEEIDKEIAELEAELADVFTAAEAANMSPRDYLNAEIKKIEEEKANQVKQINEEIDKIKGFINYDAVSVQKEIEMYQDQERQLVGLGVEENDDAIVEIRENIRRLVKVKSDSEKYIEDSIQEEIEMYQDQERQLVGYGVDENDDVVVEARENISKLEELKKDNANIDEIRREIAELEKLALANIKTSNLQNSNMGNQSQNNGLTDEQLNSRIKGLEQEYNNLVNTPGQDERCDEINIELMKLRKELKDRQESKTQNNGLTDEQLNSRIKGLEQEYNNLVNTPGQDERCDEINIELMKLRKELKDRQESKTQNNDLTDEQKAIQDKIAELKAEQIEYYTYGSTLEDKKKFEELGKEIVELENTLKELKNKAMVSASSKHDTLTDEQSQRLTELKNKLTALESKRAEIKSKADAKIKELESKQKKIQSDADKRIEDLKEKQKKLDRLEYLKGLKGKEKPKTSEKKRPDLLYKALAGVAGLGLGFGMAMVPGIGTIRMEIALAKLAVSGVRTAVNAWTKRHPEGKIAKFVDASRARREERQAEFRESHPKIAKAVDAVRNVISSPYTKWFTNGVAIGYVAGNVYEGVKNYMDSRGPAGPTPSNPTPNPTPTPTPVPTPPTPTPVGFSIGDGGMDVSGMMGYTDSYGNGLTSLNQSLAKSVKIVGEKNGMYLLQSLDGDPFAWMPKDAVDALKTAANVAGKTR